MGVQNFKQTTVYKKAFAQAMEIFEVSKKFPKEEKYSLTDQIRRSSRGVCANIAEAYRKKRYEALWISKCTDSDGENSETGVWLDFALSCKYIEPPTFIKLQADNEEIGKLLSHMITHPELY